MAMIHPGIDVFSTDDGRGRGVRATQHIRLGTCLVKEPPFASVLFEEQRSKHCEYCLQKRDKLKACGGCKCVRYCSNECQIAAYPSHQYECRFKKKNRHESLPDWPTASMLIRIICSKQKKNKKMAGNAAAFPVSIDDLCDGPSGKIAECKVKSNAEATLRCLSEYVNDIGLPGEWDHDRLLQLYMKISVNSFCVYDEESRTIIGEAVFTRSAMFNHSCESNCVFIFNGRNIEIRTIRDIQPGEEVNMKCHIHYVRLLQIVDIRRQDLFKTFNFWCNCSRCHKQLEESKTKDTCKQLQLREAEIKAQLFLTQIEEEFDENYYKLLEMCQLAMSSLETYNLEATHPLMAALQTRLMEAYMGLYEWEEAIKPGMKIIEAYKTHLPGYPLIGYYMWHVARIQAVELNQPIAARNLLQQAVDFLSIGYGSSHPLTTGAKDLLGTLVDE